MLPITPKEFRQLSEFIKANYGINLKEEKQTLVTGRLSKVLIDNGFKSFSEYFNYLVNDKTGSAIETLVAKITTNYTYFMREPDHFWFFRDTVLPYLEKTVRDYDLRIWSAGCSTGEEPYTLAMIMDEYFGQDSRWDKRIMATDISKRVLDKAIAGVYDKNQVKTLPPKWRLEYFRDRDAETSAISDRIKKEVIFREFNLMSERFPFRKPFHVIFCRNVMIYFDNATRDRLVEKFYQYTEPGGYLFIGHSESITRSESGYKFVMPAVYRKI